MPNKFPEIYKNKINNLKTKVQEEYYYHNMIKETKKPKEEIKESKVSINDLRKKINDIFKREDYIYQADVNIMYKTGEIINDKLIGFKDDYLLLKEKGKVSIDEIKDVK